MSPPSEVSEGPLSSTGSSPSSSSSQLEEGGPGPLRAAIVWMLLVLVAGVRIGSTWDEFSATIDEGRHVAAAVELYQTRDYQVYYGNPPLPRWFTGFLPYQAGARVPTGDVDTELAPYLALVHGDREHAIGKYVLEEAPDYWEVLSGARAGNLVFLVLLLFFVYRWSAELFGRLGGLVSTAIASASPLILGHGALATTDLPAATTALIAAYGLWKWSLVPSFSRALGAGACMGLAIATKATVPPFLVLSGAGLLLVNQGRRLIRFESGMAKVLCRQAACLFAMGCAAFLVVWSSYLFELAPWMERSPWLAGAIERRFESGTFLNRSALFVAREVPLPLDVLPDAIKIAKQESGKIWPAYLFGEIHPGLYHYFVVGMGLKSTLGFLLLLPAALIAVLVRLRGDEVRWPGALSVLGIAFVFLLGPSLSKMNIGLRHVLPVYAFLAIVMGATFVRAGRTPWTWTMTVILVMHLAESAAAHPGYLAYLNPIGKSWKERNDLPPLLDSNVDWGQDLARLARWCEKNDAGEITLSVFGSRYSTSPKALGMNEARLLEPNERPSGYFAISYNHLVGIGLSGRDYESWDRFRWLSQHEPRAHVGDSILVYHLP